MSVLVGLIFAAILLDAGRSEEIKRSYVEEMCAEEGGGPNCTQRVSRCVSGISYNPLEEPSPEQRCEAFNACVDLQVGLNESYASYVGYVLQQNETDENCSAVRYGAEGRVVDISSFLDEVKEFDNETIALELKCCFQMATYRFDNTKFINTTFLEAKITRGFDDDDEVRQIYLSALDYCSQNPSETCDEMETADCLRKACIQAMIESD